MRITYYGHSCFLMETEGEKLLFNPFITPNKFSAKIGINTVKMVNALHSSSLPERSYGGNPAGFVVQAIEKTFYYAGDTALNPDMKFTGSEFDTDFAFLPIGDNFTMGIHDAVKAADFVKTDTNIGMHYEPFPYIKTDLNEAKNVAANAKKDLKILEIGATLTL